MFIGGSNSADAYYSFDWTPGTGMLLVGSTNMILGFQKGAVVYLKDVVRNEVLLNTTQDVNLPTGLSLRDFLGYGTVDKDGNQNVRYPGSVGSFSQSGNSATVTYSPVYDSGGSTEVGSSIVYTITVSEGEITISAVGTQLQESHLRQPSLFAIPIMNFAGADVIAGTNQVARAATAHNYTKYGNSGSSAWYVTAGVLSGTSAVCGVWSEDMTMAEDWVNLSHTTDYDMVVLHSQTSPTHQELSSYYTINSGPWRFSCQANWLEVARRWRTRFESLTGAQPLWNNANTTVRNIHAQHSTSYDADPSKYDNLATAIGDATKCMIWRDFAGQLVLWGDNTSTLTNYTPNAAALAKIQSNNFPLQLYYEGLLYQEMADRVAWITGLGRLPVGYTYPDDFQPTYAGAKNPTAWTNWWSPVVVRANVNADFLHIFPGSDKHLAYIQANYPEFLTLFGGFGAFWDIGGSNDDGWPSTDTAYYWNSLGNRVEDGYDCMTGKRRVWEAIYEDYPVMTEVCNQWLMPYYWYSYNGWVTYKSLYNVPVNHPFLCALMGSYAWMKDMDVDASGYAANYDHSFAALLPSLPFFCISTDSYYTNPMGALAAYILAKAQLFVQYEMYNDIPTTWASGVLAYYRCNIGGGVMIKFVDNGDGTYDYKRTDNNAILLSYPLPA